MGTPFQLLGISEGAGLEEIERAFRDRVKTAHPDAGGSEKQIEILLCAREEAIKNVRGRSLIRLSQDSHALIELVAREFGALTSAHETHKIIKGEARDTATGALQRLKRTVPIFMLLSGIVALLANQKLEFYKQLFENPYDVGLSAAEYAVTRMTTTSQLLAEMIPDLTLEARAIPDAITAANEPAKAAPPETTSGKTEQSWQEYERAVEHTASLIGESFPPPSSILTFFGDGSYYPRAWLRTSPPFCSLKDCFEFLGIEDGDEIYRSSGKDGLLRRVDGIKKSYDFDLLSRQRFQKVEQAKIDHQASLISTASILSGLLFAALYAAIQALIKRIETRIEWLDSQLAKRSFYHRLFQALFPTSSSTNFTEDELVELLESKSLRKPDTVSKRDWKQIIKIVFRYLRPAAFVNFFVSRGLSSKFIERTEHELEGDIIEYYTLTLPKRPVADEKL
jgi:hypothetical protein